MSQNLRKAVSLTAIVIASVTAGVILSADLGWLPRGFAQQQQQETVPTAQGRVAAVTLPSFADMADQVMPAVVSISTTEIVRDQRGGMINPFDFFFPDPRRDPRQEPRRDPRSDPRTPGDDFEGIPQRGGGSGFIITEDGYIITNNHVVEGADRVQVRYGPSGAEKTVEATVVGRDPATDIALIKIEVDRPLPTLRLGDSDSLRVGEWAIAIGNPFEFENTLTVGVISAKGRNLGLSAQSSSFEDFIQTDAAINRGNSGGPLLNIRGEVIGINTAIHGFAQGLGFATPINVAKKIYPQLRETGRVVRGYLGIAIVDVDERTQRAFNLPTRDGALVNSVEPDQPASRAGLRAGDVIVQVDDQRIRNNRDLIDYVSDKGPNQRIRIVYYREGKRQTTTATTGERPGADTERAAPQDSDSDSSARIGISVQELNATLRQRHGIPDEERGVIVTNVRPLSPAADGGLNAGDVILEVNGQAVENLQQLRRIVDRAESGSYLRFYVRTYLRGGQSVARFAIVQMP